MRFLGQKIYPDESMRQSKLANIFRFISAQLAHQFQETEIEHFLVPVKTRFVSLIGLPAHPLGLGWQVPLLGVEPFDGAEP
jgi:hypothetical protein